MNEDKFKKVDESWKDAVQKEQEKAPGRRPGAIPPPKVDLNFFISSLAAETMMALGDLEYPVTKKKEVNLAQAQFVIDILDILKQKTEGNLTGQEGAFMEDVLSDLKMRYVNKVK